MTFLSGNRTYIAAGLKALATFVWMAGWIEDQQYVAALGLLESLGLAALRRGVEKIPEQVATS